MTIRCKNMTHAMKAHRILQENSIDSRVQKLNNLSDYNGCVYSIVFEDENFDRAISLFYKNNVILHKTEKIYYGDYNL